MTILLKGGLSPDHAGLPRRGAVLGHFPDYTNIARDAALACFHLPYAHWYRLTETDRWQLNQSFLESVARARLPVRLATMPSAARHGSAYARELAYLASLGYQLCEERQFLLPQGQRNSSFAPSACTVG